MACIFPKENGFNLNQFRWLKDLQLFQFVLHCSLTSEFFPHLNAFQRHIVSYMGHIRTHLSICIIPWNSVLEAEVCQQRRWWLGFWQPKWRGFDCEMLVALVVGDDDLRFVRRWDSSCIGCPWPNKTKNEGLPKKPVWNGWCEASQRIVVQSPWFWDSDTPKLICCGHFCRAGGYYNPNPFRKSSSYTLLGDRSGRWNCRSGAESGVLLLRFGGRDFWVPGMVGMWSFTFSWDEKHLFSSYIRECDGLGFSSLLLDGCWSYW